MLVFVEDAAEEAKRLGSQAIVIHPVSATPELIKHVTRIDGAVLLGPDAVCHAIGVILDGMATPEGDLARGARFNSALRYVRTHKEPCIAVVVSEDGGIDLIPDLLPTIPKSDIERVIDELRVVASESPIRRRRFNRLVDWLEHHAFYSLPTHCDEANALIGRVDDSLALEDPSGFHIVRQPFAANPRFDPALYYSPE
jgi:hypothetical protein